MITTIKGPNSIRLIAENKNDMTGLQKIVNDDWGWFEWIKDLFFQNKKKYFGLIEEVTLDLENNISSFKVYSNN